MVSTVLVLASALLICPTADATSSAKARSDQANSLADQAQAKALVAKARVDAVLQRYQDASAQVDTGIATLTAAYSAAADAEVSDDEATAQVRRARIRQSAEIQAMYIDGGPIGLAATILNASSADDALWRASTANRALAGLFADTASELTNRTNQAALTHNRATAAAAATLAQARALETLQRRSAIAEQDLNQARETLADLDARARNASAARASAREIVAAQDGAKAARRTAMGTVTALGIPAEYEQAYRAAAGTCPGMPWTLLAGVGQVESGHGRNNGPSSAGAIGPMQFMPATFAAYAVDGDHDGVLDPWDPQDAIFSAAHYLCVSGAAGGSAAGIHAALLTYNHAEWYVELVLAAEKAIIRKQAELGLP